MTKRELKIKIAKCLMQETAFDCTGMVDAAAIVKMPEMQRLIGKCKRAQIVEFGLYTGRCKTSCGVSLRYVWADKYCGHCGKEVA